MSYRLIFNRACVIGLGLCFSAALGGLIWSVVAKPQHVWSSEQAEEFAAASADLHAATSSHDHAHDHASESSLAPPHPAPDIEAARAKFQRISGELEAARNLKDNAGKSLLKFGLVAAAAFGIGYSVSRDA